MLKEQFVKVDSHAHITSDELYDQAEDIIKRALEQKVEKIVNIATCEKTLKRGIELAKKYPGIVYNTAATTPHDVEKEGESFFPVVKKAAEENLLVAIGETGLDYYYEHSDRKVQQRYLEDYFSLANESGLNVVIHCRGDEAFVDLFSIAERQKHVPRCLLHCFTGNVEQAKKALELGWMISMSGIVTFKKSEELRQVLKEIPIENLLIETDSPYLAPQSKRGQQNEPSFVGEVAEMIAQVKGLSIENVCAETVKNTWSFFQFSSTIVN